MFPTIINELHGRMRTIYSFSAYIVHGLTLPAQAVLTLLYIIYLFISTCSSRTKFLWNPFVQLGLDGVFVIFWIAACAVAKPTCAQFENACRAWIYTAIGEARYWSDLEIGCDDFGSCTCLITSTSTNTMKRRFSTPSASGARTGVKIVDKLSESQGVGAALV